MPLFSFTCAECDNVADAYEHVAADLGARTMLCACGSTMAPTLSLGTGLTYFESGRPRVLWNLGHEPVTVTSHEQHKRLMRERGVEWATKWQTQKTGGWV